MRCRCITWAVFEKGMIFLYLYIRGFFPGGNGGTPVSTISSSRTVMRFSFLTIAGAFNVMCAPERIL